MSTTTTEEKRRPLSINLHECGTVSSTERYTMDEAADIQRMLAEVVDRVTDGREEFRIHPRGIKVVNGAGQ